MNDKVPNNSTKLMRGGTAYSSSPFELKLQLHGQVSNPYSFSIKQNYKSSATTKASVPPYTEKSWTTPGTYTWTVPEGITRIRVAICGGGGGGAILLRGYNDSLVPTKAENGESSSFDTLIATGGEGGTVKGIDNNDISGDGIGGKGGIPNGAQGSCNRNNIVKFIEDIANNNYQGFCLNFNKESNGVYGQYGYGYLNEDLVILIMQLTIQSTGGGGGYYSKYLEVESNKTYSIKVGKAGTNLLLGGDESTFKVRNPASGFVLIAYGEGIE